MFSGNLNRYPPFFQMAVFLGLWTLLKMISFFILKVLMQRWVDDTTIDQLVQQNINSQNVSVILWFNAIDAICSFVLPPLLFASLIKRNPLDYIHIYKPLTKQFIYIFLIAFGLLAFIPALGSFINQLNLGEMAQQNLEQLKARNAVIFEDKSVNAFWRNLIILAVIPAIGEELFFRGIIQRFAMNWSRKPIFAILFTSVFFTLIHFQINNFIPIFIAGMILGLVYYWTANLSLTILIHFLYNGIQVFLNWKTPEIEETLVIRLVLILIGALILGYTLWLMNHKKNIDKNLWKVQIFEQENQSTEG